jgi:dUTP pyrophosphatase
MAFSQGYLLEPTAGGAPSQNGLAERPNQTMGNMVRCLLHSADLGPEYWSFALLHTVYLKNRLPYSATNDTPYRIYTGHKPSAKHLRIFGCAIIARQPGSRTAKLDNNTVTGRFLGYTAMDKNVYYRDDQTQHIKIMTYCTVDKAAMTLQPADQPPSAKVLQALGYSATTKENTTDQAIEPELQIQLLSQHATMPAKAMDNSAGYNLHSTRDLTIAPGQRALIPLDIAATPPPGTYLQIAPRSGLATKQMIDTKAGVIDADYVGNITLVLHNYSEIDFHIKVGDRIVQLLVLPVAAPHILQTDTLQPTQRGTQGFRSTGTTAIVRQMAKPPATLENTTMDMSFELPYNIMMSQNPFDDTQQITITVKGDHPTLGVQMKHCHHRNRLQLLDMALSTPGCRIPKWRSFLRHSYLLTINGQQIYDFSQLEQAVTDARKFGTLKLNCIFATNRSHGIHPQHGVPQLYFNQLNTIAKHLKELQAERVLSQIRAMSAPNKAPSNTPQPTLAPSKEPSPEPPPPNYNTKCTQCST